MLSYKSIILALACSTFALPVRREVPQEHSHNAILASVRTSLALNNPDQIEDPVFALLGNAAAAAGQGKITDTNCLQQAVADQAFTNAKAASDLNGMVDALIFRALERNSGTVGGVTAQCTSLKAVNPEIAAIQQHQDPASSGAAAGNKAIALALAQQIASVGGDPQLALKSGTFAPGNLNDSTGKGNTCDVANDTEGCIFTQNLLVDDATAAEISAAVAGVSVSASTTSSVASVATTIAAVDTSSSAACAATKTVTVTVTAAATAAASAKVSSSASASATSAASSGSNLQTFTGALGGISAEAVIAGGRGFLTDNASFLNVAAALGRSCDVQHNQCANAANSGGGFSASACDTQNTACHAAITSTSASTNAAVAVAATASAKAVVKTSAAASIATATAASGGNLQTFTGALGGISALTVTSGGKGFVTDNSDFVNLNAALGRSCDVQHNKCANAANSGGGFSASACDAQNTACHAAI